MQHLRIVGFISIALGLYQFYTVYLGLPSFQVLFQASLTDFLLLSVTVMLPALLVGSGVGILLGRKKSHLLLGAVFVFHLGFSLFAVTSQMFFLVQNPEYWGEMAWHSLRGVLMYGALVFYLWFAVGKAKSNKSFKADAVNGAA